MSEPSKQYQSTPEPEFLRIEGVEPFEGYRAGGYHPVRVADELRGRYRVLYKLGHGTYSTVWLTRDKQCERLVAVKVCTADASPKEPNVITAPRNAGRTCHSAWDALSMIPPLLDKFCVKGPFGTHSCLVTTVSRGTLAQSRDMASGNPFRLDVARAIAAQLVIAVDYMHRAGYVHGDLHTGNIVLKSAPGFELLTDDEVKNLWGEPREYEEVVATVDDEPLPPNVPSRAMLPLYLSVPSDELQLRDAHIVLFDFGEAFRPPEEARCVTRTPLPSQPPEARFEPKSPLTFSADIWTLACSIWAVVAQRPLFDSFFPTEDTVTAFQVGAVGKLPGPWWRRWGARGDYFSEDAEPLEEDEVFTLDLLFEDALQQPRRRAGWVTVADAEKEAFLRMIRSVLSWRPEGRPSAGDVLESDWMKRWAIPEYEKMVKATPTNSARASSDSPS